MKVYAKFGLPILIVLVGFLIMVVLLSLKKELPKKEPELSTKLVDTELVQLSGVSASITTYGRVASTQPIELYSEAAGILMEGDVPFQPAQSFSKGDLILKIDDRQTKLSLNSAKSDLLTALASVLPEIKLDFPEEYQVWQDYFNGCDFENKIAPLPETDNPKIKMYLSRFNVYKLYFTARDLEIQLDKHYIYAPFDGSITEAGLRLGATARVGSVLGKIINLEELEVEVPVQAGDIPWIDYGQPVVFTSAEISGQWSGKIKRVGSDVDTQTQTVKVFVSIHNAHKVSLLNGVFLKASIKGMVIDHALSVPRKALYNDKYVYVIDDSVLVKKEVSIVRHETESVIINGGLESGDTLVVELLQGVTPGMPARPKLLTLKGEK